MLNGSVAAVARIIDNVTASVAEAEVGALFANAQLTAPMKATSEELGLSQPATPMKTDNSTANGILNGAILLAQGQS